MIERRPKRLSNFDVGLIGDRRERVARDQERPGEALGLPLVVAGAARLARVDGVAVETQRGDETSLGMVRLEGLDV